MAGKRKAEGIALLSLYNDEGDDEEEEEEESEEEDNQPQQQSNRHSPEQAELLIETTTELTTVYSSLTTVEVTATALETLIPSLPVDPFPEDDLTQSAAVERPGNSAHGIIVDYAHDEGALSPETEEGEIMTTGRAIFGVGMQVSNGFAQVVTPPSLGSASRPENVQVDDQSDQLRVVSNQHSASVTSPTTEDMDQEMSVAKELDIKSSEIDTLADFLPPPPTSKCSQDLQNKFSKYLALKNAGRSFNEELRKSKGYRNPDFLQRAVKHQEIDQIGSCFRKDIFDPHGYDPSDFYDALALEFRREQERKEQAKKQSQRIDFAHGGVQAAPISALPDKAKGVSSLPTEHKGATNTDSLPAGTQGASEGASKLDNTRSNKKSKWDKVETDARASLMPPVAKSAIAAASAHSALLTANAGGGYASFVLQKRKEAEERSRGSDRKLERK